MQIEYPVGNHMIGHDIQVEHLIVHDKIQVEHLVVYDKIQFAIVWIDDLQISMIYIFILK
jgi:hypothetical protein